MKRVVFTQHAKERCLDYGLSYRNVKRLFKFARQTVPPKKTLRKNQMYHYSVAALTRYYWANGLLYTVTVRGNSLIVRTVTPKKREDVVLKNQKQPHFSPIDKNN